ncbi:MAG: regulatory protein GemA [Gallionella sp.]|nr:regulatory protein GemA [Gallionella sp.]MDD4947197.1 regulatory protein GemA [Gallionella sp.]MDD5613362.1 regulatory protein GemA [Gallionella sp.]
MSQSYPQKFKLADIKRREIAQIHIAKQQLCLDDETYRAMLWSIARVKSASDLDFAGRKKVLDHLKACGFKVRHTGKASGSKIKPSRALAEYPEAKKIRALWIMLHALGAVKNPSEEALASYVKRMTRVDALQWITGAQAEMVIESLKKWAMRFLPAKVEAMARQCAEAIQSGALSLPDEQLADLRGTVGFAQSRGTFDPMQNAFETLQKALAEVNHE